MKVTNSPRKDVGIWIRVSTEDQARGESPEHHEKRARIYIEPKGWTIREIYRLEGVSGKSVMSNPETRRMLDDIKSGHITGLVFSRLDRVARNTRELLEISEIFREHNADLVSLAESVDTSTPAGRLFFTIIAAMATWEREQIADRVAASVPIRAQLNKPIGGAGPYGYHWVDGKLMPHPEEVSVRKLMYELFVVHRRKKSVARLLNDAGHRTRNGSKFSDTTITRLLRDPTAKGQRRSNYTKSQGDGKSWVLKSKENWIFNDVPAIVSKELWEQCNCILDDQLEKHAKPSRTAVHPFAGITFCECGTKMYVSDRSPKYRCRHCRNKIPIVDLDAIFQQQLKSFFLTSAEIGSYRAEADTLIQDKEGLMRSLLTEQSRLGADIDKLYALYLAGEIPAAGFGARQSPLEERLKQIDDTLPKLQGEVDFLKIRALSSEEILSEAQDLFARWTEMAPVEKRGIVENIADRITVDKGGEVSIVLRFLPASTSPEIVCTGQQSRMGSSPRQA